MTQLDVYNGLLLAGQLDALFDRGLMTFTAEGVAQFSPRLATEDLRMFVSDANGLRLSRLTEGHTPYLDYHRRVVFSSSVVQDSTIRNE